VSPGVKRLDGLLAATKNETELNAFATVALKRYQQNMIATSKETTGLFVAACHRANAPAVATAGLADSRELGLHYVGRQSYRKAMVESSKHGDVDGVVALYNRAVKDGVASQDLLHVAVRACLAESEGTKASALFEAARDAGMDIAPATVRLVDATA